MNIDGFTFRAIAGPILASETALTAGDARAIVQLGYLASGADLDDDRSEVALHEQLGRHVCALAGISFESVPQPSPLPLPIDDEARIEWLEKLCSELTTTGARELGYVIAYLVTIGDQELAPVESALVLELQQLLGINEARAAELVAQAAERATPMSGTGIEDVRT